MIGVGIFIVISLLPNPEGLDYSGQLMIALFFMVAWYWVTEAMPLPATALMVIVLLPLLNILETDEVFIAFGNQAVFFLIGAFILASALETHNLHKRIALYFLRLFEGTPRRFIFGIMVTGASISFIIPEHAVVVLLLPIILLILRESDVVPRQSDFGRVSIIAIAYGCSIGSLATPIGGARNPLAIGFLDDTVGQQLSFIEWMKYSLPIVSICLGLTWIVLMKIFPPERSFDLSSTKHVIQKEIQELGSMNDKAKLVIGIMGLTIVLWIFMAHELNIAIIALIGSVLLFVTNCISWKDIENSVPWGIILLYGGAITLGVGMERSGAASWITGSIVSVVGTDPYLILFMLIVMTIGITNMISNTASVAMLLPIGYGFSQEVPELTPLLTTLTIAFSGGLAFMLIIATPGNLITYSSGHYSSKDLLKAGFWTNIVCIVVIFIIAITYWDWIGVW